MKKLIAGLAVLVLLTGCSRENRELQQAMDLRSRLLSAEGCSFQAEITADYGDSLYAFTLDCQGDALGAVTFQVKAPETIAGITGKLTESGGQLTFDGKALDLGYVTEDQLSPLSAPWIFLRTLRGGYLTGAGTEGEKIHVLARDSYEDSALALDIWLEAGNLPVRGEILCSGRRILTLEIRDFRIL